MYFEIYQEPAGLLNTPRLGSGSDAITQWRWRLRSNNHEIIASGEGYQNKQDCENAINLVKKTDNLTEVRQV